MAKKKSKGLGDTIEKVTKATGIKKLVEFVAGEDCGCEVYHDMHCVWVLAFEGNEKINGDIKKHQPILNHTDIGSSSWLKEV